MHRLSRPTRQPLLLCLATALLLSTTTEAAVSAGILTDYDALLAKYVNASWTPPWPEALPSPLDKHEDMLGFATAFLELHSKVTSKSKAKAETRLMVQNDENVDPSLQMGTIKQTPGKPVGMCEVCVYVMENHEQRQPYLCRGLKDPNYQKIAVQTLESMMWWLTNEVYWVNYGCERTNGAEVEWIRPCPPTVICSWIEHLYFKEPFCPKRPDYQKPT